MAVSRDILRSWRHPRRVMARHLALGQREDRALIFLMLACAMIFISQWPRLAEAARLDPSTPLDARLGGALFGWFFVAPLAMYGLAALSRLLARLLGGQGSWYSARLALFWSLLAVAPLWLINATITTIDKTGLLGGLSGIIALAAFVVIWLSSMIEAETGEANR